MTASVVQDSVLGRTIAGKYFIESSVGSGAMGTVYRARQIELDKTIALKVLRRDFEQNEEFVGRFRVEARAASKLDHPNSTRVIDFGREPDGLLYIAMEYLEGRDLYEVMCSEGPFSAERSASVIAQALAAIAVAHEMGVLHRDLKPENFMLLHSVNDEGCAVDLVKVCDFGIAKLSGSALADKKRQSIPVPSTDPKASRLTRMGTIMGTPAYMSPEQACGDEVDARSDIYSIGIILYEMLTGRVPFEAATPEEVAQMHVSTEPRHPLDINPRANVELSEICLRAMQKSPGARYATAREMRAEIRNVITFDVAVASGPLPLGVGSQQRVAVGETPTLPQLNSAQRTTHKRTRQRKRPTVLIALGAVAVLGVGIAGFARYGLRHRVDAAPAIAHVDAPIAKSDTPAPRTTEARSDPTATSVNVVRTPSAVLPPATAARVPPRAPAGLHKPNAPSAPAPSPVPSPTPEPVAPAPPPAAPPVATADPPAPTPAPTPTPTPAAPAPAPVDPARARMDVGSISVDRMNTRDVNAILGRGDLRSCYVASVRAGEPAAPGPVVLSLEVEDMRVLRARASGAGSSPSLRKCLESRLIGSRAPSADTGSATAKIPLTFSSQ